jgi:hypothetical protein
MKANKLSGFPLVPKEPYAVPNNGLPALAIITLWAKMGVGSINIDGLVEFLAAFHWMCA